MGNRGTVVFTDGKGVFSPAVYMHWNGGPESVYGFLAELDRRKVRADQCYEAARLCQLVGEFFDHDAAGGTSLGISNGPASDDPEELVLIQTDLGDNGLYLVNRTTKPMVVRRFSLDWGAWRMIEMSPDDVLTERLEANAHKNGPELAAFYQTLHPAVSPY